MDSQGVTLRHGIKFAMRLAWIERIGVEASRDEHADFFAEKMYETVKPFFEELLGTMKIQAERLEYFGKAHSELDLQIQRLERYLQ